MNSHVTTLSINVTREQLAILTAFQNNIEIFSSNYHGSLVSFSKEIVTFALTGVKYSRRRKTIVLYVKKTRNEHGSHSFMLIKYFYLFFTAVSARLKHN